MNKKSNDRLGREHDHPQEPKLSNDIWLEVRSDFFSSRPKRAVSRNGTAYKVSEEDLRKTTRKQRA